MPSAVSRSERFFFFQAEDGIRDLVRSRGLGDVYKRQVLGVVGVRRDAVEDLLAVERQCKVVVAVLALAEDLSLIHI